DFAPITRLWTFPSILAVPSGHPANSVNELVAHARSAAGGLSYASQGPGSGGQILGAMLQKATGAPMTHVPYRGPAPAIVDLVAGVRPGRPAGLPEPIVGIVRERTLAILHAREMRGKISQQGWVLTTSTPDEFRDLMRGEIVRVGQVLKEAVTEGR